MRILSVLKLINEYNTSGTNTTLAAPGGKKAAGKNFDNIITGKASPYKTTEYEVKYAKLFPHLAQLVKKIKSSAIQGDMVATPEVLAELEKLQTTYKPKQTPEGDYSLPFGDNIRMKNKNGVIYIGPKTPGQQQTQATTDTDIAQGV
jgi:hypothetical protein